MMWGKPNSVTMVASSAQIAADVELVSFLTRKYFENMSVTMRKSQYRNVCNRVSKVLYLVGAYRKFHFRKKLP